MIKKKCHTYFAFVAFTFAMLSCSTTKFVEKDSFLLDKVNIESDNLSFSQSVMKPYLKQQPNYKIFGIFKWPLYIYNWSGKDESKWINKQFRRMGEEPTILDETLTEASVSEFERYLTNKGYMHSQISATIDTIAEKKAVVNYSIKANKPYKIRNYTMNITDEKIDLIIRSGMPEERDRRKETGLNANEYNSLIKKGSLFDRDILDLERTRITKILRNNGYFDFNKEHLGFMADSALNSNEVDIELYLKESDQQGIGDQAQNFNHKPYYIKNITMLTDFNPLEQGDETKERDTLVIGGINILSLNNNSTIRSSILEQAIKMSPGELFRENDLSKTYRAFSRLRALRNANIKITPVAGEDSIDYTILTSSAKLQTISTGLDGTNSAGNLGFAGNLTYQHLNLFKGSEVFSTNFRGAYETLTGMNNYWEFGAESSLLFPRFMFPLISEDFKERSNASTEFKLSYNLQTRPEYVRTIASAGWNYLWQSGNETKARHVFKLLNVDFVYLPRIDQSFKESLPPATVQYNYSDQFIIGSGYSYSYNNYNPQYRLRNTSSLRLSIEGSGNGLYAISKILNKKTDENGAYNLFGVNYSQFLKADIDIAKGLVIDDRNKVAMRFGFGIGVPYGNSAMLPFEERYFSGGANSVRGWAVRTLGPGSMPYPENETIAFALQTGDIRLDANIEYRTKLFWKFEAAAYIDAGNIWTIRSYEEQPNGHFDFNKFYKEIAVSYGLGLRMDFDFFLIRFDTGMKAYNPQETGSKKWAITNPNLTNNFAWHFAVGYPF